MAKLKKKPPADGDAAQEADPNARYTVSDSDKAKARKWFARAQQLVDTRSYDYAVKCYIDGLALWPEAIDEGREHRFCRKVDEVGQQYFKRYLDGK